VYSVVKILPSPLKIELQMKLHTIDTGFFKLDGGAMFGVVPKMIWNKTNPADDKTFAPGPCVAC
jgi:hypothetical protein